MKKLFIILSLFCLVGCGGFQITDSSTHKVLAYSSGKLMAITINKQVVSGNVRKDLDKDLTTAWVGFMQDNSAKELVDSAAMTAFYNECLFILTEGIHDPYGLIGDLTALLTVFSAQMDPESNQMISVRPVPYSVLQFFERGYDNGRRVVIDR